MSGSYTSVSKNKKLIFVVIAAVLLVAGAVAAIILFNRQESYRVIKVVELKGTAIVERESTGQLQAYVGMNLQSGDRLVFDDISTTTIMLDDDKYILLEPGTVLVVEAYGNAKNNQTTVMLEQGAILNTITEKLGENSSYVVNVPNAVMAVRGTCYRVAVVNTDDGKYEISLEVFTGNVESQLKDDNGEDKGESVSHGEDTYTVIYTDDNSDDSEPIEPYYAVLDEDVDYENIPDEVVKVIMDVYYSGHAPLQDTVRKLIDTGKPAAINYVMEHDYQPTGTNTGTEPDLGDITAQEEQQTDDGGTPSEGGSEESSENTDSSVSEESSASDEGSENSETDNSKADNPEDSENPEEPDGEEPVGGDGEGLVNDKDEEPEDADSGENKAPASDSQASQGVNNPDASLNSLPDGNGLQSQPTFPNLDENLQSDTSATESYTVIFIDPDGNEITRRN